MSTTSKFDDIEASFAPYLDASPSAETKKLTPDVAEQLIDTWCARLGIDLLTSMETLRTGLARGLECLIDMELHDWFGYDYYGECVSNGQSIRVHVRLDGDWHYREHNEAHELGHILLFHVKPDQVGVVRRGHRATTVREQNAEMVAAVLLRRARRDRARAAPPQSRSFIERLTEMAWERWLP